MNGYFLLFLKLNLINSLSINLNNWKSIKQVYNSIKKILSLIKYINLIKNQWNKFNNKYYCHLQNKLIVNYNKKKNNYLKKNIIQIII